MIWISSRPKAQELDLLVAIVFTTATISACVADGRDAEHTGLARLKLLLGRAVQSLVVFGVHTLGIGRETSEKAGIFGEGPC